MIVKIDKSQAPAPLPCTMSMGQAVLENDSHNTSILQHTNIMVATMITQPARVTCNAVRNTATLWVCPAFCRVMHVIICGISKPVYHSNDAWSHALQPTVHQTAGEYEKYCPLCSFHAPVSVDLLFVKPVPVDLAEFMSRPVEQPRVDLLELENTTYELLVVQKVSIHRRGDDAGNLWRSKLHVRVALMKHACAGNM